MSNIVLAAGGDDGYQISRSVRLRSSASGYFSKTFGAAGNRKKWTYSAWIKRGTLGTYGGLIASKVDGNNYSSLEFSGDELRFVQAVGGSITVNKKPAAVFRDPSAWYHIIAVMDTDNATAEDRFILYVNGVRVTTWASNTPPALGLATGYISSTTAQWIGLDANPLYFDGYLADVNFIDGLALTASSFGEIDILTGVWKPKKYAGTYGTNGFYLNFSDNSAATASAIGKDWSGNGNNWTPNNISLANGTTYDSMIDTPTPYADGGNGRGNYCVLSPLDYATAAPTNGNLTLTNGFARATMAIPSTGKWYWENTIGSSSNNTVGLSPASSSVSDANGGSGMYGYHLSGNKYTAGSSASYGASYTSGDVIGVAVDADAGTVTFYKNNVSQGVAFSGLSFASPWLPLARPITSATTDINFGQRPFAYTPPTGFKALNTQNLPDSTIKAGNKYFDATIYTGTNANRSVTNSGTMQPDLVWLKSRSSATNHMLNDSVRGVGIDLYPNLTNAESNTGLITSFNSNGFSLGPDGGGAGNGNGLTYVGWQWKKGATQGFDIVTYTGTGSATTVAHSLGVAPKMMIVKNRTTATGWLVYHASVGNTGALILNGTNATITSADYWNNTSPTSSVFTVGVSNAGNQSGNSLVAYLFSEVAGFSKFGSYTGNGSTSADGPFVYLGFRPRFIMGKRTDSTGGWWVFDTARDEYNLMDDYLYANTSDAEQTNITTLNIDVLSNGFKVRSGTSPSTWINASGGTYIYAAFAENPFKNSLAR